jgi:hypothetical protein
VRRSSSLRGALAAAGPLTMACFWYRSPPVTLPEVPAPCDQPHDTEHVGAFTGTLPLPQGKDAAHDYAEARCIQLVASYVGSSTLTGITPGWLEWDQQTWDTGRLTVRCFALPEQDGKRFTASVKGIGRSTPPTVNA